MPSELTKYDLVAYPGYTHPQTHPDRLAVIGSLFGLDPALITSCRVLELGCGNGTNLAPIAWALPNSEFVGIDLANLPIRHGQQMVRDLGLGNLRLVQGDLAGIDAEWGQFDYIIAHGVYSWVSAEVRARLLEVCAQRLAPHGIAFVSYNALPGSHLRAMVREMMLFHVAGSKAADERVQQAKALVQFLAQGQDTRDESRLWMKAELERVLEHSPEHLYHDDLADINEPIYFTQFMQQAAHHGLQYLGEADCFEMSDQPFNDSVRQTLQQLAKNRLLREQYLDFLKCRRFRQTLLCRREARISIEPQMEKVADFLISSAAICAGGAVDVRRGVKQVFQIPNGANCQTDLPAGKAALALLGSVWPAPMPFGELLQQVTQPLAQEGVSGEAAAISRTGLCEFLLRLYAGGVVEFRTAMPPIAKRVSARPLVYPVARWQAAHGDCVASLFHMAVKIEDEIGRCLLSWLDGTQDRDALLEKLWLLLKSRNALVIPDGNELAARRAIESKLEENLEKLARLGLLTG
jgi:SAM-dependent methyltransferase